jgi:gamma-glutamylcyclotransferase (GGCT)/AIG2-like uncharacterized protein YtfP
VHGTIVRLADPRSAFLWLDDYEEFVPGSDNTEYVRAERLIRLAGSEVAAWVYLYLGDVSSAHHISSGCWE